MHQIRPNKPFKSYRHPPATHTSANSGSNYKEDPMQSQLNLTSDDQMKLNKEAFDKTTWPRFAVVSIVSPCAKPMVHLGGPPPFLRCNMSREYFHNDGKDAETEVLFMKFGHAIDGATWRKLVVLSTHSSVTAVQITIHKAYPVMLTMKVGRHCLELICSKTVKGNPKPI